MRSRRSLLSEVTLFIDQIHNGLRDRGRQVLRAKLGCLLSGLMLLQLCRRKAGTVPNFAAAAAAAHD